MGNSLPCNRGDNRIGSQLLCRPPAGFRNCTNHAAEKVVEKNLSLNQRTKVRINHISPFPNPGPAQGRPHLPCGSDSHPANEVSDHCCYRQAPCSCCFHLHWRRSAARKQNRRYYCLGPYPYFVFYRVASQK